MLPTDDDLQSFEAHGAAPLPAATHEGYVENDGARIWYSTYGAGETVILLHGGLGNSGNWGNQVPALVESGRRVVLIDSRGHGRSTRDSRPYSYELMASDVTAVMDAVGVEKAAVVGWSDGACIALILAMRIPSRITRVFYFACNMDPSGTKEIAWPNPVIDRCLSRHRKDYARLSARPDQFDDFFAAIGVMMKTEPNYTAAQLARVHVPVTVAISERDEFIRLEHAQYLASTIPGARLILLPDVTHFAPLQRPDEFNRVLDSFLGH
jgi:pimeloyl-ACP methyl ester carboxylesterase